MITKMDPMLDHGMTIKTELFKVEHTRSTG